MIINHKYSSSDLALFTVADLKPFLGIPADVNDWNGLIALYISEAQAWAERETSRLIGVCSCEQDIWRAGAVLSLDGLWLPLKYGKLVSVDEVFVWNCGAWDSIWAGFDGDVRLEISAISAGRIRIVGADGDAFKIHYTCGTSNGSDIPPEMITAIRRYIFYLYNPLTDKNVREQAFNIIQKNILNRHGR